MPQPGWYPSPKDPVGSLSFWDGDKWTGQTLPSQAAAEVEELHATPQLAQDDFHTQDVAWDDEAWEGADIDTDNFLTAGGDAKPKLRRERTLRTSKKEKVPDSVVLAEGEEEESALEEEDALTHSRRIRGVGKRRPPLVSLPERPAYVAPPKRKFTDVPGFRGAAIGVAAGLALIAGGLFGVPALLDPMPAGGPVAAGEVRASAEVREVSLDEDGFCYPTVVVSTGVGSGEARALKLRELNTACPVKVDEVVTVYFSPQDTEAPARYVADGEVPVDIIMWSVVGIGALAAIWGSLRYWAGRTGRNIKYVSANPA